MSTIKEKLSGVFAPVTTPFKDDGLLLGREEDRILIVGVAVNILNHGENLGLASSQLAPGRLGHAKGSEFRSRPKAGRSAARHRSAEGR